MASPDFALQWLNYHGTSIYNNGKRILEYHGEPNYEISALKTYITVGEGFGEEEESKPTFLSFPDFERLGYCIKRRTDYVWRPLQKYSYVPAHKKPDSIGISQETFNKSGMKILHDAANKRFRLMGENVVAAEDSAPDAGVSDWIEYEKVGPISGGRPKIVKGPMTKEEIQNIMSGHGSNSESKMPPIPINELPVIISDEKSIVCIPKQDVCQRIIVVGSPGFGKSLVVDALAGRIFWSWGDGVGWLLDPLNQFYNLSLPQDVGGFNEINSWIGNEPKPIPALQLYMACKYKLNIPNPNISLKLTLKFEEFLNKYKLYTYGIKDYDVGDTIRYLLDYFTAIKNATSGQEISDEMFKKIPNAYKDKGTEKMIYKWKNTFDTIFKERFTSNLYVDEEDATDKLKIKLKDGTKLSGHPFIMAIEAGLVPVLNISTAKKQRWIRNYLADLMQKILAHQIDRGNNRKRFFIIADELNDIYEKGKKKDKASDSFIEMYRQGRINEVGFLGNTQSLDRLEPDMYKNASYIFSVYLQSSSDRKQFKDFKIEKETYEMIGDLDKMEIMLFRSPLDPFVVYDKWGRRKVYSGTDRRWFRGKIIPPINHHEPPRKTK